MDRKYNDVDGIPLEEDFYVNVTIENNEKSRLFYVRMNGTPTAKDILSNKLLKIASNDDVPQYDVGAGHLKKVNPYDFIRQQQNNLNKLESKVIDLDTKLKQKKGKLPKVPITA